MIYETLKSQSIETLEIHNVMAWNSYEVNGVVSINSILGVLSNFIFMQFRYYYMIIRYAKNELKEVT